MTSKLFRVVILMFTTLISCTVSKTSNSAISIEVPTQVEIMVPTETIAPTVELVFSGEDAYEHVVAQVNIGPRPTGSENSRITAQYISANLEDFQWTVEIQPFEYNETVGQNIIARAGDLDGPIYIVGAHYDTRRQADNDPVNPTEPVIGANDGASGVAVLLELARTLDLEYVDGQVWLVFFDAEDNGRLDGWEWIVGSTEFVERLTVVPEYAIIVDMVGETDQQLYLEINSDQYLKQHLWKMAGDMGYSEWFIPIGRYSILDDHTPFLNQNIPAVDIIDFDYPAWHTTADTLAQISPDSLERVGRVLEAFLESGGQYPIE